MITYKITIKEKGSEEPLVTYYGGDINIDGLIAFFGLKEPDVEWYTIEEE